MNECANLACAGDFVASIVIFTIVFIIVWLLRPRNKWLRLLLILLAIVYIILMVFMVQQNAIARYGPYTGEMKFLEDD